MTNKISIDELSTKVQYYLSNGPLVILGSGISAAYGFPTMGDLSQAILNDGNIQRNPSFQNLRDRLSLGEGLESALNGADISTKNVEVIRRIVWDRIAEADKAYLGDQLLSLSKKGDKGALEFLLTHLTETSSYHATVVTTNYDRLVEIAADNIGATCVTGFEGNTLRLFEGQDNGLKRKRINARERVVELWKVHGSIDWFKFEDGRSVCVSLGTSIPNYLQPLIVPPCNEKYQETHEEPYRELIGNADVAFGAAKCFLAVGYGFGDQHIHPILDREVKKGKPLVIVTKCATDKCVQWIESNKPPKCILIQEGTKGKSRVRIEDSEYEVDSECWSLEGVNGIWL